MTEQVGMKYLVVLISIFLFVNACNAADSNARQGWDMVHITGSALGAAYFNHLGLEWYQSAIIMFTLGIAWELADQLCYNLHYKNDIFDYRIGFDKMDILRNSIGISISFPIRKRG